MRALVGNLQGDLSVTKNHGLGSCRQQVRAWDAHPAPRTESLTGKVYKGLFAALIHHVDLQGTIRSNIVLVHNQHVPPAASLK